VPQTDPFNPVIGSCALIVNVCAGTSTNENVPSAGFTPCVQGPSHPVAGLPSSRTRAVSTRLPSLRMTVPSISVTPTMAMSAITTSPSSSMSP
jgi:hypothetical protein